MICLQEFQSPYTLISEDGGRIRDWRFGDDFVVKDRSQTKVTRREIQVVEQEEDLRDKCSERTMSRISRDFVKTEV